MVTFVCQRRPFDEQRIAAWLGIVVGEHLAVEPPLGQRCDLLQATLEAVLLQQRGAVDFDGAVLCGANEAIAIRVGQMR